MVVSILPHVAIRIKAVEKAQEERLGKKKRRFRSRGVKRMPIEILTCKDCGSHDVVQDPVWKILKCARCGSTRLEKSPKFSFIA